MIKLPDRLLSLLISSILSCPVTLQAEAILQITPQSSKILQQAQQDFSQSSAKKHRQSIQQLTRQLDKKDLPDTDKILLGRQLARYYQQLKKPGKALQVLQKIRENTALSKHQKVLLDQEIIPLLLPLQYFREAISLLKPMQQQYPHNSIVLQQLRYACVKIHNYDCSIQTQYHLLAIQPEKAQLWKQLAQWYLQAGQKKKALATLRILQQQHWLDKNSKQQLIQLLQYNQEFYQAATLLQAEVDNYKNAQGNSAKNSARWWYELAILWHRAKEIASAKQAMQQALKLDDNTTYRLYMTELLLQENDYQAACKTLDKILAAKIEVPSRGWLLRGICLANIDQKEKAIMAFQRVSKAPEKKAAHEWLQSLQTQSTSQKLIP